MKLFDKKDIHLALRGIKENPYSKTQKVIFGDTIVSLGITIKYL